MLEINPRGIVAKQGAGRNLKLFSHKLRGLGMHRGLGIIHNWSRGGNRQEMGANFCHDIKHYCDPKNVPPTY